MEACEDDEDIIYTTGNPQYVDFKPNGTQPLHVQLWYRPSAKDRVRDLVERINSLSESTRPGPRVQADAASP
jgi:hypothetical protein